MLQWVVVLFGLMTLCGCEFIFVSISYQVSYFICDLDLEWMCAPVK